MMSAYDVAAYEQLVDYVETRVGIQFTDHRHRAFQQILPDLLASVGIGHLRDLYDLLDRTADRAAIWQQIIQALTIGETYFYRNQAHVQALMNRILPELIRARRAAGNQQLRIWSAGCATGEEPYTLAMILRDLIPDIANWSITLLATDVNQDYLRRAREGLYRAHAFRGETPDWLQKRWFTPQDGGFLVNPIIRNMVTFAPLNLIGDVYPSAANGTMFMDLIVCRNVTIYFDRSQTQLVVERFYDALADQGWLLVGHSEPQPGVYDRFVTHHSEHSILYQKAAPAQTWHEPPIITERFPVQMVDVQPPVRVAAPVKAAPDTGVQDKSDLWTKAREAANQEAWDVALQLLKEAETDDVLQPHIHYLRGLIYMQRGMIQESLAALRQAIYCDPNFALAHYSLGEAYEKVGAPKDARRYWLRARRTLSGLDSQQPLPHTDDLTVEMLNSLLDYQLNKDY